MKQLTAFMAVLFFLIGGCGPQNNSAPSPADRLQAEKTIRQLQEANQQLQVQTDQQQQQITTLQNLGEKRLDLLFVPTRIDLGRYTGGIDTNDLPGDDAIKVYLEPIDQTGDSIKAAGEVTVQLYDLAADSSKNLLGEYQWSPEEIGSCWKGGLMSRYFALVCPWKETPTHDEITVRVVFTDYLTGKTFSAQKTCKISLPE